MPAVDSPDELRSWMQAQSYGEGVYMYFGSQERRFRPGLEALADPSAAPAWLQPVATGTGHEAWVLYLYRDVP